MTILSKIRSPTCFQDLVLVDFVHGRMALHENHGEKQKKTNSGNHRRESISARPQKNNVHKIPSNLRLKTSYKIRNTATAVPGGSRSPNVPHLRRLFVCPAVFHLGESQMKPTSVRK